jgi:hypothetical protein
VDDDKNGPKNDKRFISPEEQKKLRDKQRKKENYETTFRYNLLGDKPKARGKKVRLSAEAKQLKLAQWRSVAFSQYLFDEIDRVMLASQFGIDPDKLVDSQFKVTRIELDRIGTVVVSNDITYII